MSLESAMASLTAAEAPTSASQVPPSTLTPKEGPQTLQEAIRPVKREEAPKPPGGDRFAALAKKERALQAQMQQLKAAQAKQAEYESARAQAASNPIKALESLGLSYEQITQFMLNGNKVTPELELKGVKDEIAAFKAEQLKREEDAKTAQEKRAKAEYQATLSEFNQEVADFISTNAETYELTSLFEGQAIVSATIEQHFAQTKKILSIKEASELVEKYFEDQVNVAQKAKKFQAKQQPKEESQPRREQSSKTAAPTISNELTSSAPSMLPAKTEQDRLRRAMAALEQGK